ASERRRAAADLGQPAPGCAGAGAALEPGGTAIADDAAHHRTEVVAADGELVRAEKIIACARNRAGADIAVIGRPGRVGEIDGAAGIGDELRVTTVAVIVELREPTAVRRDGRVGGGAIIVEQEHAAVVDDDDGVSGRAPVVEVQIVVVGKAWRERGIVDDAGTVDVEGDSCAARYEVKSGRRSGE